MRGVMESLGGNKNDHVFLKKEPFLKVKEMSGRRRSGQRDFGALFGFLRCRCVAHASPPRHLD